MKEKQQTTRLDLWERAKSILMMTIQSPEKKGQLERYFSMITSVVESDGLCKILTENSFAADLLRNEYLDNVKSALILAGAKPDTEIRIEADETARPMIVTKARTDERQDKGEGVQPEQQVKVFTSTMPLRDEYTFDEFVRGPSNSFAHAAAISVADRPGRKGYNPLFIHGGTGLGKTHLMQAIGNELIRKKNGTTVCYLTAEVLLNEFVNAIQNSTMDQFRNRYRSIDVLMVDDIQFIATRKQLQEEFFNTFQSLYNAGKEIVMTCDIPPKNLHDFDQRLISRFEGGMVVGIELPSYETRLAILRKKAEAMTPTIPDNALKFIAENIKSHVRAMEGALGKVNVMMNIDPTMNPNDEVLMRMLSDFIEKEKTLKKITIEDIQNAICRKYSVTMRQILSSERTQSIVTPRQLAMYISRKYTTKSLPEIAKMFDKSHATIVHGVKSIEKHIDVEPELKKSLEEILEEFGIQSGSQP